MINRELEWQVGDGLVLYGQEWQPEEPPQAVILLVHGLGEHSGRYHHVGKFFAGQGFLLTSYDLRGHGKTPGKRGHVQSYQNLVDDLTHIYQQTVKNHPGLPVFLYGHSFGGALVLHTVIKNQLKPAGVIVTGPGLAPATDPGAKAILARFLYAIAPMVDIPNGLDVNTLSKDPQVIEAYRRDPLVFGTVTVRFGVEGLRGGEYALEHAQDFPDVPLLIMRGSLEQTSSPDKIDQLAQKLGSRATYRIWDGLHHELHNEPEQADVLSYLAGWLIAQAKPAQAQLDPHLSRG